MSTACPLLRCLAATLGGMAAAAQAAPLYANFDPAAAAPDYSTTAYADISGSCSNVTCLWINSTSASFQFRAQASGQAARAYLPMQATYTLPGAERLYGLTLSNADGEVVARGGFYGRDAPIGTLQVYEIELYASLHAGQPVANGVLDPDAPELVAGELYTVSFAQTYGSMSGAHWMKSSEVPLAGQAQAHCATNGGSYCAYWNGSWVYPLGYAFSAPMTDFLPALVITDAAGLAAPPTVALPLPASSALVGLALAALSRRRFGTARGA